MHKITLLGRKKAMPKKPDYRILEAFENRFPGKTYEIAFRTKEFTTLCPMTGQPDFAEIVITYIPDRYCIESKSLKFYLHSYRNIGEFHEHVTNRILQDFVRACRPRWARIEGIFNARGGIGITVTAEHGKKQA